MYTLQPENYILFSGVPKELYSIMKGFPLRFILHVSVKAPEGQSPYFPRN